jgi:hypothetical protein
MTAEEWGAKAREKYTRVERCTRVTVLNDEAWISMMCVLDGSRRAAMMAGSHNRAAELETLIKIVREQSADCMATVAEDAEQSWNPEALAVTVRRIADRALVWVNHLNRKAHAANIVARTLAEAEPPGDAAEMLDARYAAQDATLKAKRAQAAAVRRSGDQA